MSDQTQIITGSAIVGFCFVLVLGVLFFIPEAGDSPGVPVDETRGDTTEEESTTSSPRRGNLRTSWQEYSPPVNRLLFDRPEQWIPLPPENPPAPPRYSGSIPEPHFFFPLPSPGGRPWQPILTDFRVPENQESIEFPDFSTSDQIEEWKRDVPALTHFSTKFDHLYVINDDTWFTGIFLKEEDFIITFRKASDGEIIRYTSDNVFLLEHESELTRLQSQVEESSQDATASEVRNLLRTCRENGLYREGAELADYLIRRRPDSEEVYQQKADLLVKSGQPGEAIRTLETGLEREDLINEHLLLHEQAKIFWQMGHRERAFERLRNAIELEPVNLEGQALLLTYLLRADRSDGARELTNAMEPELQHLSSSQLQEQVQALLEQIRTWLDPSRSNPPEPLPEYALFEDVDSSLTPLLREGALLQTRLHVRHGNLQEALHLLANLLDAFPDHFRAWHNAAFLAQKLGNQEQAEQLREAARYTAPQNIAQEMIRPGGESNWRIPRENGQNLRSSLRQIAQSSDIHPLILLYSTARTREEAEEESLTQSTLSLYREIGREYPSFTPGVKRLISYYIENNQYETARGLLMEFLPASWYHRYNLAYIQARNGDYNEALNRIENLPESESEEHRLYRQILEGYIHLRQQNLNQSLEVLPDPEEMEEGQLADYCRELRAIAEGSLTRILFQDDFQRDRELPAGTPGRGWRTNSGQTGINIRLDGDQILFSGQQNAGNERTFLRRSTNPSRFRSFEVRGRVLENTEYLMAGIGLVREQEGREENKMIMVEAERWLLDWEGEGFPHPADLEEFGEVPFDPLESGESFQIRLSMELTENNEERWYFTVNDHTVPLDAGRSLLQDWLDSNNVSIEFFLNAPEGESFRVTVDEARLIHQQPE